MIFACMIVIMFITGCAGGSSSGPVVDVGYKSGTEGLKMEFLDNMPTDSLFAGEMFNIGLNLENVGAFDIDKGIITISGFARKQYNFPNGNSQEFQLRGKSQYEPKGEVAPVILEAQSICYPSMAEQVRTNITTLFRATACYSYATVANAQVCIDTNPLASQGAGKKICEVKAVTLSGGQGGPIAVTKVEPSMIPVGQNVKARFMIFLKNMNSRGMVFSPSAVDSNCESPYLQDKIIFAATLSGTHLYCNPAGEINLRLGEETRVICEMDLNKAGGVYETQIAMSMEYAYSQDIAKKVNVNKPLNVNIPACS